MEEESTNLKIIYSRKYKRTGSIKSLIDKTPEYELKKGRRLYNRSLNSSLNIFSDEYHKGRSTTPTYRRLFFQPDNTLSAGLEIKLKNSEVFTSRNLKKKMFPDKSQVIFGGSSK